MRRARSAASRASASASSWRAARARSSSRISLRDRDAEVRADQPFLQLLEQRGVDRAALEQAAQLARQGRAAAIEARAQPAEEAARRLGSGGVVRRCFGHGGILAHAVGFAPMGATRQGRRQAAAARSRARPAIPAPAHHRRALAWASLAIPGGRHPPDQRPGARDAVQLAAGPDRRPAVPGPLCRFGRTRARGALTRRRALHVRRQRCAGDRAPWVRY